MSYLTYYHMEISEPEPSIANVASKLAEKLDNTQHGDPAHEINSRFWEKVLNADEDTAWYDHQETMKELSTMWPNVLFTLAGTGEENDDQWIEYHMDGKMQRLDRPNGSPNRLTPVRSNKTHQR